MVILKVIANTERGNNKMAQKQVFLATSNGVEDVIVDYEFHSGFALSQVRKNINSIHDSIVGLKNCNPLEVSSKGTQKVSAKYSAFNLKVDGYPLEVVFQGAKVFEDENEFGPFFDEISKLSSKESKAFISKFSAENGYHLKKFSYQGKDWPLYPKTLFYDWMYYRAFTQNGSIEDIEEYDAFTDVCFNFHKSLNCQARSLALIKVLLENSKYSTNICEEDFYKLHRKYVK